NNPSELEMGEGVSTIRLRKVPSGAGFASAPAAYLQAAATPPPAPAAAAAPPAPAGPPPRGVEVRSRIAGTFYKSPSPESPHFVGPGDRIKPDSVVCIVEAM